MYDLTAVPRKKSRFFRTGSREALVLLLLFVSILLAGFNSGNNLLYLISGVMLGVLLVAFAAGRINLSGLEAYRRLPKYAFAGHSFKTTIEVANNKRFARSFGIFVEEGRFGPSPMFLFSIGNGEIETKSRKVAIDRRGIHTLAPVVLRSNFPFGLFNMKKRATDRQEIIVYPHIRDLTRAPGGASHIRDEFPTHLKGPGSGLYGFREYRHGEEATNISWKLSAKLGMLIIRETEHEEKRRVCIVFDNAIKDASPGTLADFEIAVSNAASLVWYLCRNNYSVKLVTRGKVVGYGSGPEQMHRMLVVLALIDPIHIDEETPVVRMSALEGGIGVLVTTHPPIASGKSGGDFAVVMSAGGDGLE